MKVGKNHVSFKKYDLQNIFYSIKGKKCLSEEKSSKRAFAL